jgi:hypothetical protein
MQELNQAKKDAFAGKVDHERLGWLVHFRSFTAMEP